MNKFLESWMVDRTDHFRQETPKSLTIDFVDSKELSYDRPPFQTKHQLRAEFVVEFWANQAQYDGDVERAKKYFLRHIYGDVTAALDEITYLIRQGYTDEAVKVIERVKEDYKYDRSRTGD